MADNPRIDDLRKRLDREPGSRVFAQFAEELRKAGQLPEAIRVARQGLVVHPGYPSARMTLGRALMDLKDLRGARAEFEAVLRGANDNILASRFLGECLEGLGDLGSALLQYRATLRLAPGDRNLEAQIRALEERLTPIAAAEPAPVPQKPAVLRREGAIPVLDVDGPMELETSFEKPTAWPPAPEFTVPPASAPAAVELPTGPIAAADSPLEAFNEGEPVPEPLSELVSAAAVVETLPEPLNQSFPADWDAAELDPVDLPVAGGPTGEAPALSSSTLAELYFNQGFTRQAIDVYRELLEREPTNDRFRARIHELEAIEHALEGGPAPSAARDPAPAPVSGIAAGPAPVGAASKAARRAAIERSIVKLEGFLSAVRRA